MYSDVLMDKKGITKEELMRVEDDRTILEGYSILKSCVDDLASICQKTDKVKEYCLPQDFSVNGATYSTEVDNCKKSIRQTMSQLEEFATSLVKVVDAKTLAEFKAQNPGIMDYNYSFLDVNPSVTSIGETIPTSLGEQSTSIQPTMMPTPTPQQPTSDYTGEFNNDNDFQQPQAPTESNDSSSSQTGPNGEQAPQPPQVPTGPNDPNASQVGPNGEQPPAPPSGN